MINNINHSQKAGELFVSGCNCAQAVLAAFQDMYDLDEKTVMKVASAFGGGMGRMREVCGAVTGMLMVLGLLYGDYNPLDHDAKTLQYTSVQKVAKEFAETNGSVICRELLNLQEHTSNAIPSLRTEEYYQKRPCRELVECAAGILEKYIEERIYKSAKDEV